MATRTLLMPLAAGGPARSPDEVTLWETSSPAMAAALELAARVVESDAPVLICGESGSGKTWLARAIHRSGSRGAGPFVVADGFAAGSDFLDHERVDGRAGDSPGTAKREAAWFARASGGTLLLRHIHVMVPEAQARLHDALRAWRPAGAGGAPGPTGVRVMVSTAGELERAVEEGLFARTVYRDLVDVVIRIPPLRDRVADLRRLAEHFLEFYARLYDRPVPILAPDTLDRLYAHHWPGNLRELRHLMERAVLMATDGVVQPVHLRDMCRAPCRGTPRSARRAGLPSLWEVERRHISAALMAGGGHLGLAARLLGIPPARLRQKLREGRGSVQ